jgi:hypothetical protein
MEVKVSTRSLSEGQVWAWGELGGAVKGTVAHGGPRRGSRNASRRRRERVLAGELGLHFAPWLAPFSLWDSQRKKSKSAVSKRRGESPI